MLTATRVGASGPANSDGGGGALAVNQLETESNRVNIGEEDELHLEGFAPCLWKCILLVILVILSGGILLLVLSQRKHWKIRLANTRCSLAQADFLIVQDKHDNMFVEKVHLSSRDQSFNYRYFCHKKLKYIWNSEYKHFVKLKGLESEKCSVIYSQSEGATTNEALIKQELYGPNSIEIQITPIWKLIYDEITGPFYLYQFFIVCIWCLEFYYLFCVCILVLSLISVAIHVWQTRKQTLALKKKVHSVSVVRVLRNSRPIETISTNLVPGDVIILPKHKRPFILECDAVLMTGSCLMDESMLTGESVPEPKVPLVESPSVQYSPVSHKSNTLFSGTKVLNVQSANDDIEVKAVVVRIGFSTAKGELARSILFPAQVRDKLNKQLVTISCIYLLLGIPCIIYAIFALKRFQFPRIEIFIVVIDVSTFLISPVLPALLTSISFQGQRRLRGKGIFCLNPRMISKSGDIDVMCFDKTGTLTEDSIDLAGVVPVDGRQFGECLTSVADTAPDSFILKSMACCHSLNEYSGNLEGDDLDLKLFTFTDWTFVKQIDLNALKTFGVTPERIVADTTGGQGYQMIGILKQFPFESFLQRMMVIVKDVSLGKNFAIIKGAPEMITSFCNPETLPKDFQEIFDSYTSKGFRVLATAYKELNEEADACIEMSRSDIECNMTFGGLLLFKNKLKSNTASVIHELREANIRCVMVTGDNLLTAINIANECGMVKKSDAIIKVRAFIDKVTDQLRVIYTYVRHPDFVLINNNRHNGQVESGDEEFDYHLAIDGDSFKAIRLANSELLERILHKGTIFARMSPEQKITLISSLQKQDHSVGMCGDGANDCGALRCADAGISLSMAEASVASPFTYKEKTIACVPDLLKEGRCTLVAIVGAFKYEVCYCFTLLSAVLTFFWHGTKPSEGAYILIDIVLNVLPPIMFGTTEPYKKLSKRTPIRNVLTFVPQFSMYSFILIQTCLYVYVQFLVMAQPWYKDVKLNLNDIHDQIPCHLSFAVLSINMMSYVIAAIIFAPGPPYRKSVFSNPKYIGVVMINFLIAVIIIVFAPPFLLDYLKFEQLPFNFRMLLLAISLINFLFCLLWEKYFINKIIYKQIIPRLCQWFGRESRKRYEKIGPQISADHWPFELISATVDHLPNKIIHPKRRSYSDHDLIN